MILFPNCKIYIGVYLPCRGPDGFEVLGGVFYAVPRSAAVVLLPHAFADVQTREAAIARVAAALDRDDQDLRRRFDDTCGLTCKRAKPAFEAFLEERRAEFTRRQTMQR